MVKVARFRQTATVPRQPGELGRLRVLSGPDSGCVFVIRQLPITVGRGDENDVVVSDLKSSRKHAQFQLAGLQWQVQDLGSANGILHNGKAERAAFLKNGDTVSLGETTVEFLASEASTSMLTAPPRSLGQLATEQAAFSAQQEKVRSLGRAGGLPRAAQPRSAGGAKSGVSLLTIVVVGGGLAFLLLAGNGVKKSAIKKSGKENSVRDLASYLPSSDPSVNKTAESFFRMGFREYREKNFIRARQQFETVLQISPGHQLAQLYLENCNQAIEDEVKFHLEYGKKSYSAGSVKAAREHFEAVLRLLYRDQSSGAFIEAKEQLDRLDKDLPLDGSPLPQAGSSPEVGGAGT